MVIEALGWTADKYWAWSILLEEIVNMKKKFPLITNALKKSNYPFHLAQKSSAAQQCVYALYICSLY